MINRAKLLKSVPPLSPLSAQSAALGEIPAASTSQTLDASEPASPPKSKRPAVLVGVASVNVWLREQVKEILATEVSEKTRVQYERNGSRLDAQRDEGEAVSLEKYEGTASTFYAYRAAVRWHAAKRGREAMNEYDKAKKAKDEGAAADAWQRVLYAAADLKTYQKDAVPGLPTPGHVALGLADAKQEGAPAKAKREGREATSKRETAKLGAANSITKNYPDWRERLWRRLVEVESPWLDHTAIAALTGARPDELRTAKFQRDGGTLKIFITGAKVTEKNGQPWRAFTLKNDGTHEFEHLFGKAAAAWKTVDLPDGVTDYPDAFSAALARAGKKIFPGAKRMSGYVYRHVFASDMKKDGATHEHIAAALGHAATRTQQAYGSASGGTAGKRNLSVSCAREIRATHDRRYTNPAPQISINQGSAPAPLTFSTPSFGAPTP